MRTSELGALPHIKVIVRISDHRRARGRASRVAVHHTERAVKQKRLIGHVGYQPVDICHRIAACGCFGDTFFSVAVGWLRAGFHLADLGENVGELAARNYNKFLYEFSLKKRRKCE